ncbi:MAG TPA: ThuA domain-containing protein [Fimbriiglobus sp.]|jgi:type 1 glutamine amidotransferase
MTRSILMTGLVVCLSSLPACAQNPKPVAKPTSDAVEGPKVDPYDQSKVPLEVPPPPGFKGKVILLVAGKASHGPGEHEFFAGTAILMNLLKQTPGVWPIMARDGWPKNEKLFDLADSFVFYMDGRNGHPVVQKNRLDFLQKYMDKGVGWANLHYAVDYLPEHGARVLNWMGGYYDFHISFNPHWDADIRSLPKHPITRGVKPFTIRDEWYYNMHWIGDVEDVKDAKGVTPILQAIPPDSTRKQKDATASVKKHVGEDRLETMAWAFDRKDGGRGFGFTGAHFHRNWADEDFRRVVVNALLWTAKVDIPEGGAKVDFDPADLNKNLDKKGKGPFKPIVPWPPKK